MSIVVVDLIGSEVVFEVIDVSVEKGFRALGRAESPAGRAVDAVGAIPFLTYLTPLEYGYCLGVAASGANPLFHARHFEIFTRIRCLSIALTLSRAVPAIPALLPLAV
jgi:hypothetical protein